MVMADQQMSDLFVQGTAPERDPDFARRVTAEVSRERLRMRLGALTLRAAVVLMISGAAYSAAGMIKPVLAPLFDGSPQFMGVPLPMVLGALAAGLALSAGRYALSLERFAPPVL
jgi:hypothetical protein